jgi:hypothetical protein
MDSTRTEVVTIPASFCGQITASMPQSSIDHMPRRTIEMC